MGDVLNSGTGELIPATAVAHVPATVVPYAPAPSSISLTSVEPQAVILNAMKAATALMEAIRQKRTRPVIINGERYIEVDEWLIVARFYGCSVTIVSTTYVSYDGVYGFEAIAALIDKSGREIGRAESMCLSDEERWSTQAKKEWAYCLKDTGDPEDCSKHDHSVDDPGSELLIWVPNPKKEGKKMPQRARIVTGDVRVPLFQLRSMAQTRATGKICRLNFGFVPALAGFRSTPAEEMEEPKQKYRRNEVLDDDRDESQNSQQAGQQGSGKAQASGNEDPRVAAIKERQKAHKAAATGGAEPAKQQPKPKPAVDISRESASPAESASQPATESAAADAEVVSRAVDAIGAAFEQREAQQSEPSEPTETAAQTEAAQAEVIEPVQAVIEHIKPGAKGRSAEGPWQLYTITFASKVKATDGIEVKQATTISEPIAHKAFEAASASEKPFVAVVVEPSPSRKGSYTIKSIDGVS